MRFGIRSHASLAVLENEEILHIEFQSTNDAEMPYRMLEYYTLLAIHLTQVAATCCVSFGDLLDGDTIAA